MLDLEEREEITRIAVGDYPEGLSFSARARRLYVANWFDNSLSVIDVDTASVIDTIATGDGSRAFGLFILE